MEKRIYLELTNKTKGWQKNRTNRTVKILFLLKIWHHVTKENLAKLTDVYTGSDDRVGKLKLTVGDIAFGKRSKPITRMVYLEGELHVVTLLKTE